MPVEMVNPPTWILTTRWTVAVNCHGVPLSATARKFVSQPSR
jgi:hypothetical protein